MNRKSTSVVIEFGNDDDPVTKKGRALLHEQHRERIIVTILAHLYLMSSNDILPINRVVGAEKAYWQDYVGSEADGTEAAHCVPCQIRVTGYRPEQYVRKYSADVADEIIGLFGKTDPFLPAIFNKCDSRSEAAGLVNAFWDACIQVIDAGLTGNNQPAFVTTSIRGAFGFYKKAALKTFNSVIFLYDSEAKNAANWNPKVAKESQNRKVIVQYYSEELTNSCALNDVIRFGEIDELINLYKSFQQD